MAFKIQPSFSAGELAPALYARPDLAKFHVGCRTLLNFLVRPHGGVCNRPGTLFVGEVGNSAKRHRLVRFEFSTTQAYILVFGHLTMQVIKDRGFVMDGSNRVQVTTPYGESDLPDLYFTQSADTLYIAHPSYAPRKLTRSSHTSWTLSSITFAPPISAPQSPTATVTGLTSGSWDLNYKISAVTANGEEGEPSAAATAAYNGTWTAGGYVTVSWTAPATGTASEYNVYKDVNGYYGWVGTVQGTSFKDNNVTPSAANGPQQVRNPFSGANEYPGVVSLHEQRTVWARSNNKPATFWGSRTGDYQNMNVSSPIKDDDAYSYTLAAREVNPINGMCSLRDLILLTGGAIWKASGDQDKAITAKSIYVKPQTLFGSEGLPPIIVGDSILYVQRGGRVVRDLAYALDKDGYNGNDLSILAEHLFLNKSISEWTYAQNPYSIVWCVADNGGLYGLTYMKEHDVVGWHRHETDGTFESVAAIPGAEQDDTYVIVNRTIGGATKRYVEVFSERIEGTDVVKSFFVDSGLIYDGTATSTLSGLDHLEGKTVAVFADGAVQPSKVVTSGAITLARACEYAVVGLPYTSDFESLDIDMDDREGTSVGRVKTISKVIFKLEDTRGLWCGTSFDKLYEVKMRAEDMSGDPIPLYTGEKEVVPDSSYSTSARVCVRQTYPVPLTISAIIPEVQVSEQRREGYSSQRMEIR